MNSNNDLIDPNWRPSEDNEFIQYLNKKKIEYNRNHAPTFNTVHITDWSDDYFKTLRQQLDIAVELSGGAK